MALAYGYDSGHPTAAELNAVLVQAVFEALAELCQAPWAVGGDWNAEVSAIWSFVAADGRGLLLPTAADAAGLGTGDVGGRLLCKVVVPGHFGVALRFSSVNCIKFQHIRLRYLSPLTLIL